MELNAAKVGRKVPKINLKLKLTTERKFARILPMKKHKKENKIRLMVYGVPAVIDYDKQDVSFAAVIPKEIVSRTNFYLLSEGFLDEEFIKNHESYLI